MGEKSADSPSQDQLHFNGLDQEQEQGDMISINYDCSDDPSSGDSHYQGKDETEVNESSKKRKRSDTSRDPVPLKRLGPNREEIPTAAVSIRHSHPYSLRPRSEENLFDFEDEPVAYHQSDMCKIMRWCNAKVKASRYADPSLADGLTYRPIGSGKMREQSEMDKTSRYADSSPAEGFLTYPSSGSSKKPGQSEVKANDAPPKVQKQSKNKEPSSKSTSFRRKTSCWRKPTDSKQRGSTADSSLADGYKSVANANKGPKGQKK